MTGIRTSGRAALAAAVVATGLAMGPGQISVAAATHGVCAGIDRCRVVARVDVDGDRRDDRVGWVARKAKGLAVIRVLTADGERLRKRLDVSLWFDTGAWGGATPIDGRGGVEMLVGTQMGAHTPVYAMLTYRRGDLVIEKSPAQGDRWFVDSAWSVAVGWDRDRVDGRILMRYTYLTRSADDTFDGSTTTYRWRKGCWVRVAKRGKHVPSARAAEPYAGWHVRNLERFPGVF
jgi:hypothetical protein